MTGVLPQVVDAVVSKQRLLQAIYAVPGSKTLPPEEDCITYALCPSVIWHIHRSDQLAAWLLIDCRELVRNGLLIAKGSDAFLFSVPHASKFVDSVIKGRKELVQLVKRRKYSEIPQRVGSRALTNRVYGLICAPVRSYCILTASRSWSRKHSRPRCLTSRFTCATPTVGDYW